MHDVVLHGDCLQQLAQLPSETADLIYLDPPFFTNRVHKLTTRDASKSYYFDDTWSSVKEYNDFIISRLRECRRVLKLSGSIYFHGDRSNIRLIREAMDDVFGGNNFQSEIIWYYKRWSNSKKGLLQQHQNILFYSKSTNFKWNQIYTDYSVTTNVDQIMQQRTRDGRGKTIYAADANGELLYTAEKKGVPLGDVWEIPFLNPKAKERTGYPTQKPLLLLERLIKLTTDVGDLVVDPFCGSGTTLVASKLMHRRFIGIDIAHEAAELSRARLGTLIRTESNLVRKGAASYKTVDQWVDSHLIGIEHTRVHRNGGIDCLLKSQLDGQACFLRVQREGETLASAVGALISAAATKGLARLVVVATQDDLFPGEESRVHIIPSQALQIKRILRPGSTSASPSYIPPIQNHSAARSA